MARRRLLVAGATGYVGGRLVPELLSAGHEVRCVVREPAKLDDAWWQDDVEVLRGDVTDAASMAAAMQGIDTAYYLVHSMGTTSSFEEVDQVAARCVADAAARSGVGRIVYLGGLGRDDDPHLSRHLGSRHEVGRLLAGAGTSVTELRAAVVIGSGSASFEMLRYLVEVLPVMVAPRWVDSRCQPIAVRDVLVALVAAASDDAPGHHVVEIGGPDVLTYREMMQVYAEVAGLPRRWILPVPLLSPRLSSLWISLVTPLPANLARPLVDSLVMDVVVTRPVAPGFPPPDAGIPFRTAVRTALQRSTDLLVATRWSDASLPGRSAADPMPTDADWSGGSVVVDEQSVRTMADPDALFRAVTGVGGDRGWYVAPALWALRGWADRLVGGVGMRRGRRHPDDLFVGDALDFWRVEAVEPGRLLRLRAEMRLPGEAWLEWRIEEDGTAHRLVQRAIFVPRGLWGRAYWYAMLPFHAAIFGRLAARLARAAEPDADGADVRPRPAGRSRTRRGRFRGEIAGFGTSSGHRVVVGRWWSSPFGAFTDVMVESPSGVRTLLAPSREVADLVAATYVFDEVRVVDVRSSRSSGALGCEAADLRVRIDVGRRTALGRLLRAVPTRLAESPVWCGAIDPVARVLLRGVRTTGTAGGGRREWYGATDQHELAAVSASWAGRDLGPLRDVWPPVRFGFSSTPRRPSIVRTTTTIDGLGV